MLVPFSMGCAHWGREVFITTTMKILRRSANANGREPLICLGLVFNFKLGSFTNVYNCTAYTSTAKSRVENSAQVSPC